MRICDIHTHVMPGVDDGAASVEESLEMLRCAQFSGVAALAATPHVNVPGMPENYYDEAFLQRLRAVRASAQEAKIDVMVLAGMEVRLDDRVPTLLREKRLLTLNGSRYLLSELPTDCDFFYAEARLSAVLAEGYVPVIAHPERYRFLWEDPFRAEQWLEMGCHLQLTGDSILGRFGRDAKAAAQTLLERDMVACVASDAHGNRHRTTFLTDVYNHLSIRFSQPYADALLWHNPMNICRNLDL